MADENICTEYTSNQKKRNQRIHKAAISWSTKKQEFEIIYSDEPVLPEKLVKYFSLNGDSIDALYNNYLWAANPLSFNDPFDCPMQLWNFDSFSLQNCKNHINSKSYHLLGDNPKHNRSSILKIRFASLGIICLNEFRPENQDVIWGYYTNQKGFSITFNTHSLINTWGQPFKIEYTDELDRFELDEIFFAKTLRWGTQKKTLWKAETEWRFIFPSLEIETLRMDAFPSERKRRYLSTAINEINLGLKFFPAKNTVEDNEGNLTFVTDPMEHELHNKLLSFLSNNDKIKTNHIFFKEDLNLHRRPCKIDKTGENLFRICYDLT